MSNRACYAVLHVISQVINRWIDPNRLFQDESRESTRNPIEDWDYRQWKEFLDQKIGSLVQAAPNYAPLLSDRKFQSRLLEEILSHIALCKQNGAQYILFCDESYPETLKAISDPPIGISIWGYDYLLQSPSIALIGSRRASLEALGQIPSVVKVLSDMNTVVVSGGAYGCDIAAHRSLLRIREDSSPLPGVIVLAGGLGNLYPKGNLSTFTEFVKRGGVILSERLWNADIKPYDFPIRNRIISGLSQYIVVMEASEKSGALVTAKIALDQGRDVLVFAAENSDYSAGALGSKNLIEEGAYSFSNALELKDYFDSLGWSHHAENSEFI